MINLVLNRHLVRCTSFENLINFFSSGVSLSQSQPEILPQLRECSIPQTDFLLPVHVRQSNLPLLSSNDSIPSFKTRNINEENSFSSNNKEFYRICPTRIDPPENLPKLQVNSTWTWFYSILVSFFLKFVPITSTDRQMELLEEYTADQSMINWKSIFEGLQDYRKKAIEQSIIHKSNLFFDFLNFFFRSIWTIIMDWSLSSENFENISR